MKASILTNFCFLAFFCSNCQAAVVRDPSRKVTDPEPPETTLAKPTAAQAAWQELDFGALICLEPRTYNSDRNYPNVTKLRQDPYAYADLSHLYYSQLDRWVHTGQTGTPILNWNTFIEIVNL